MFLCWNLWDENSHNVAGRQAAEKECPKNGLQVGFKDLQLTAATLWNYRGVDRRLNSAKWRKTFSYP